MAKLIDTSNKEKNSSNNNVIERKGDGTPMDIDHTSPGKGKTMTLSPSSGCSYQNSPRKYCRRQFKILKSDVRGRSTFDSNLGNIQARNEIR